MDRSPRIAIFLIGPMVSTGTLSFSKGDVMARSVLMLDRAQAPTLAQAQAALAEIGGKAWAYYLGGAGHFKDRTSYTPRLIGLYHKAGIQTLPIYAGAQSRFSRNRGLTDAKDAASRARNFGDTKSPIMCDIERAPFDRNPAAAVEYARGWCFGIHAAGMRAGVYGPFQLMVELTKRADPRDMPDVLWPARWISDPGELPAKSTWPKDARGVKGIPAEKLANAGNRAWQFVGDVVLPHSRINVDISVIDLDCFTKSSVSVPAPRPAPTPAPKPAPVKSTTTTRSGTATATATATKVRTVTIKSGDTLFALETKHGVPHGSLFKANAAVLDAAARKHGHANSRNGGLIFPGTVVKLP